MSRTLRYAVLTPLSVLASCVLFVLPDIDLGWPGGVAMFLAAWLVGYLLPAATQVSAVAGKTDESIASVSPGEQRAWIGLVFTAAILILLRAAQFADGRRGRFDGAGGLFDRQTHRHAGDRVAGSDAGAAQALA